MKTLQKQTLWLLFAFLVLVTTACQPLPPPAAPVHTALSTATAAPTATLTTSTEAARPTASTPTLPPMETFQDVVDRQPSHLPAPLPEGLSIDIYRMNRHPIAEDLTYPQVLDTLQGQSRFSRFPQGNSFWTTLSMAAIAENNASLIPFGYHLTPNVVTNSADLYQGEKLVLASISMFGNVSVNQSATDFMMLAYTTDSRNPFVVVHAGSLEDWQRGNGWIANSQPQYLNNDVMYTELKTAEKVSVYRSGQVIYTTDAPGRPAASGYIGFWTFGGHWGLEVVDRITIDGQPVNARFGYTKSYEFHVLRQKPLFFFEKDGRLGLNYAGKEILLPWQAVDHYGCCSAGTLNPVQVGNLLLFFARQGDRWDYVELEATASPPTNGTPPAVTGTVHANEEGSAVNIRSGPGAVYDRIGTLPDGQAVKVTGRSPRGEWWRVLATDGMEGWVFSAFISVEGDAQSVPCVAVAAASAGGDCSTAVIPAENEPAVAAIRAMLGSPNQPLFFQAEDANPNADMRKTLIYTDNQGGEYWLDRATLQVVQWTPKPPARSGEVKTTDALRAIAKAFARQQSALFRQKSDGLTYSEITKDGDANAFRWEDRTAAGHSLFPFLQVVIRSDGQILNYHNTLDILLKNVAQ